MWHIHLCCTAQYDYIMFSKSYLLHLKYWKIHSVPIDILDIQLKNMSESFQNYVNRLTVNDLKQNSLMKCKAGDAFHIPPPCLAHTTVFNRLNIEFQLFLVIRNIFLFPDHTTFKILYQIPSFITSTMLTGSLGWRLQFHQSDPHICNKKHMISDISHLIVKSQVKLH